MVCTGCGSINSFRYNRHTMRMECYLCHTPAEDYSLQEGRKRMEFDRSFELAERHLNSGNFSEAVSILRPLINSFPQESKLYISIFRAVTSSFSDFEMENEERRNIASEMWRKLSIQNKITPEMQRYSREFFNAIRAKLRQKMKAIIKWLVISGILFVLSGVEFRTSSYFLGIISLIGGIVCLIKFEDQKPFSTFFKLVRANNVSDYTTDPFWVQKEKML